MVKVKIANRAPVRPIPHHKCTLVIEDQPATFRIFEGIFVPFRRRFWKWFTVDPTAPQSKKFIKSAAQIYEEESRHLDNYPYMIHPFSQFRFVWESFMILYLLFTFFSLPFVIAADEIDSIFLNIRLVLDLVNFIDIFLWFLTGYFDEKHQIVRLKFTKILKRYLETFFIFDLLSAVSINVYLYKYEFEEWNYFGFLLMVKIVRITTLFRYIKNFSERYNFYTTNIKFCCFILWLCILLFWISSLVHLVLTLLYPDSEKNYGVKNDIVTAMYKVTKAFMAVGVNEIINTSDTAMLVEVGAITIGSCLEIVILAKIMQMYHKSSVSRNKYKHLLQEIREYIRYKELPTHLKDKIFRYVDFKFQKNIYREEEFLNNLSSVLKHDILLQRCERMIQKVDFFKDLPPHAMLRIVTKLKSEIFLPGDVIVLAGYAGHAMYFIYMGTVAVYTPMGKEICHLDDGEHFGEIALIINEPRVATVVAVKECELFRLSRKDFQEAIEPYPELNKKIRKLAMKRLENTMQMISDGSVEDAVKMRKSFLEDSEDVPSIL